MQSTLRVVTLDDGATTTVEQWGESGPALLCVHGMTSSRKSWLRLARHLSDRYRVFAYDQRGHGDSAAVHGPMSLERGVRDLENVAAETGADVLIGHSWGGAVAIRGGLRIPAERVIAIDPMLVQVDDTWYEELIADLDEQLALHGNARDERLQRDYADWHEDDVEGKRHALRSMTSAPIAGLRDENRGGTWDLRSDVAAYDKPLLLIMAGEDSIVPAPVLDDVRANHHGPLTIVTLRDEGHNLHRTDFETFAGEVDEFLDS